jgi:hemolysin activation/secretion protein
MAIWRHLKILSLWLAGLPIGLYAAAPAAGPTHYYFRHLILAPSLAKANLVKLEKGSPKIVIESLRDLGNKEFSDFISPYIGQEITSDSLGALVSDVKKFLLGHGQALVNVSAPPQNVANGEVRLVVVLGAYELGRLVIGGSFETARDAQIAPNAGQIVIDDLPVVAQQSFAVAMAPYFGQPITDESLDSIIGAITSYVKTQGQIVAKVLLPPQDIRTGQLRLAVYVGRYPLRRLVLASSPADLAKINSEATSAQIVAPDLAYFRTPQFEQVMAPYFGRPIDKELDEQLRKAIANYVTTQDRVAASIPAADINLATGEFRLVVPIEHYSELRFKGNRWFSDRLLSRQFGIKPGDEVRVSQLDAAVNEINQNPYRHAQVLIDTVNKDPGVADVDVAVQEIPPYRITATYDDTGNDILGNNHYTLGAQFGNLFGLDQQVGVQYTTTDVSHAYQSAVLTYRAPLPWHHYISFTGAYVGYRTDYDDNNFHLKGSVYQGDLRYVVPIIRNNWSIESSVGIDYKQTALNQVFKISSFNYTVTDDAQDIAQATASVTGQEHDTFGTSYVNVSGNFSPGNFNKRNTDAAFQGNTNLDPVTGQPLGALQAQARYMYGNAFLQRLEFLPDDFQFLFRTQAQLSSARLVGSERFSIGGAATVRGYDERIMSGDEGWTLTTEIRSPAWKRSIPFTGNRYVPIETRLLAFYDDGRVDYRHPNANDIPLHRLSSAGLGVRSNWAANFSVSADYGWQISDTGSGIPQPNGGPDPLAQPNHGRFHLQGSISY